MKILVTGGAGFIGSHVVDHLVRSGHDVDILDDLSAGSEDNINVGANFYKLDIRSKEAYKLVSDRRYEVIVHHAAQMDVRKSVYDPSFDADVNIRGFLNLAEAGRHTGVKKFVFASTGGAIYGEPDYTPQDENHALLPLSPYGITKLCTEKYLYFYQQQYGIEYVSLRYGNIYGPRQNPHGEAGVIAIFAERLLRNEKLTVFGDGLQTRDYVFVTDVAEANLLATHHEGSGIFNVGTGVETNVNQLVESMAKITESSSEVAHQPERPGEQRRSVLSFKKLQDSMGWKPKVQMQEGLEKTIDWFRTQ